MCYVVTKINDKYLECPNLSRYIVTFWRKTSLGEEVLTVWRVCEFHFDECKKLTRYISHKEIKD